MAIAQVSNSTSITISISPEKPFDLPPLNGRQNNNLTEASIFAWEQFISHTWPAKPQKGNFGSRDEADVQRRYGEKGVTGQVVWETFRHKSEIFPGGSGEPNGFVNDPAKDYGYDALPVYTYDTGLIPPATGQAATESPFDNLDETNEILLCDMSAGISNSRILYQAKANRVLYKYSAQHRLFEGSEGTPGEMRANAAYNLHQSDEKNFKVPYVRLPSSDPVKKSIGSMEAKSAWRRLGDSEDPSRFYTNRVRFYVREGTEIRYKEETWGLVALHIIHKTESSPVFIYTSFSQVDNIRDVDGTVVEEPDGLIKSEFRDIPPFAPELTIFKSTVTKGQEVFPVPGSPEMPKGSKQLFFQNLVPFTHGLKTPIAVRRRLYEISSEVRAVNRVAQAAIRKYDPSAVWQYYKLVNVQGSTLPSFVDRSESDALSLDHKASFFMANEVVETNVPLQQFSGTLSPADDFNPPSFRHAGNYDFALFDRMGRYDGATKIVSELTKGQVVFNTFQRPGAPAGQAWKKLNTGGCVGCHGPQGQLVGGDFSVILARGRVTPPETQDEHVTHSNRLLELNYLRDKK
ncbi:hypothetical protein ETAA8_13430 [Anatilimnocola aggregata]|uniref:Uncharacterized protein n=2 Tax=Anatilimnocola aggregata TaxID=2528021 RepID=A0A517Y7Q3_9BACT|nr:hypothetical protein ETAA8_13430 [Anatilimnocola aggregata]